MELRPYQEEAIASSLDAYAMGIKQQLICLPTGTGKTLTFSSLIARAIEKEIVHHNHGALVIVPRIQLLYQSAEAFRKFFPDIPCSIFHHTQDQWSKVTFSTLQTLISRRKTLPSNFIQMCVYDEAHHAVSPQSIKVLDELDLRGKNFLVGLTATSQRTDKEGLQKVFKDIVYTKSIHEMIDLGFLCPLKHLRVKTGVTINSALYRQKPRHKKFVLDEDEEKQKTTGPFNEKKLGAIIDCDKRNELIVKTYLEHCQDRKKGIVFCINLSHAEHLAKAFNENGIPSDFISYYQSRKHIKKVLHKFKTGEIKMLCNMRILTEGFDEPSVDLIMMATPTSSELTYTQMVGRGTRIFPGKENCLVVDFRDNCKISLMDVQSLEDRKVHGENPYPDREEKEEGDDEKEKEPEAPITSDGQIYVEEVTASQSKNSQLWRKEPCTEKQLKMFAYLQGKSLEEIRKTMKDKSKGEMSDMIQNSPCTEKQIDKLLQMIKSEEGTDEVLDNRRKKFKDLSYGQCCQLIQDHSPPSNQQIKILEEYGDQELLEAAKKNKIKYFHVERFLKHAQATQEQIDLLRKMGVNATTYTNFLYARKLIKEIVPNKRSSNVFQMCSK